MLGFDRRRPWGGAMTDQTGDDKPSDSYDGDVLGKDDAPGHKAADAITKHFQWSQVLSIAAPSALAILALKIVQQGFDDDWAYAKIFSDPRLWTNEVWASILDVGVKIAESAAAGLAAGAAISIVSYYVKINKVFVSNDIRFKSVTRNVQKITNYLKGEKGDESKPRELDRASLAEELAAWLKQDSRVISRDEVRILRELIDKAGPEMILQLRTENAQLRVEADKVPDLTAKNELYRSQLKLADRLLERVGNTFEDMSKWAEDARKFREGRYES